MTVQEQPEVDPDLLVRATALDLAGYGPLAIPAGQKSPPPNKTTGHDPSPTLTQWYETVLAEPGRTNLGVRLPLEVVGVDVDAYDDKGGKAVWETLNDGDRLPNTVVVSARFGPGYDGLSGIRLYRLPPTVLESELWGAHDGIEIIRFGHRYLMAPGSLHPSGSYYRALDVRTRDWADTLPRPEDLPELSEAQARRLTRAGAPWARKAPGSPQTPAPVYLPRDDDERPREAPSWPGEICPFLGRQVHAAIEQIRRGSSRHDTMTEVFWSILNAASEGHSGGDKACLQVGQAFFEVVTADGSRTPGQARAELKRSYDQAVEKIIPVDPMLQACCGHVLVPGTGTQGPEQAQEEIWEATPWLAWCDRTGRARGISRYALLGALLARTSAEIAHCVVVESPIGAGGTPLNLYVLLLGESGTGKSLAHDTIEQAHDWKATGIKPGSGEGLAAAFMEQRKVKGEPLTLFQHTYRVYAWIDEYASLASLKSRAGATIASELRSAWSAQPLGFANRAAETRLPVAARSYRLAIAAGIQPSLVNDVFAGATVGDLQRWLWFAATDPAITADQMGADWEPLGAALNLPGTHDPEPGTAGQHVPRIRLKITERIRQEVINEHALRQSGHAPNPDSHRTQMRLRVAGLVAQMDRRWEVSDADWDLAGALLQISDRTRTRVERDLRLASERALEAKATVTARFEAATEDARLERVAATVARRVHRDGTPVTRKQIKDALTRASRPYLEPGLERAIQHGWIVAQNGEPHPLTGAISLVYAPGESRPR